MSAGNWSIPCRKQVNETLYSATTQPKRRKTCSYGMHPQSYCNMYTQTCFSCLSVSLSLFLIWVWYGMGQNQTTREPQILVLSIYQGKPFWGYLIFDPQHAPKLRTCTCLCFCLSFCLSVSSSLYLPFWGVSCLFVSLSLLGSLFYICSSPQDQPSPPPPPVGGFFVLFSPAQNESNSAEARRLLGLRVQLPAARLRGFGVGAGPPVHDVPLLAWQRGIR